MVRYKLWGTTNWTTLLRKGFHRTPFITNRFEESPALGTWTHDTRTKTT